ncbi:sulfatase family protein [Sediminitomix flava]|uniref:Arylsulfatase A-like enzyme n=1 Tax=Sediminitomix flava TaxID=379075 RepID=A0A315Z4D7_SEDFL|nr:sulfatase-like hydrolase/transferase [Sediminitomix flava]PWJ37949.1 arylsulfatase A-like enzyme [Sediminitomix flava]
MKKRYLLWICLLYPFFIHAQTSSKKTKNTSPNILIIVSDDQGWGDVGFNGSDIPTPQLDALAEEGIVFTQGYASHPYCSPSRAGLLSGRYQQRFGHENNIPYQKVKETDGLPLEELLMSEHFETQGYQTCAIGKWHLGDHEKFWPNNRGFDDWFGFYGGGNDYWGRLNKNKAKNSGVLQNGEIVAQEKLSYLTDDFSNAASKYIEKYSQSEKPFFMYLAYNAPHSPIQAPKKYFDEVAHIEDGHRAAYAAMVVGMDQGIQKVVEKLKETGEYENTIIIFYSDNGAHTNGASSFPFRGHKGMLFEGGIRVPFLISWPKGIEGGKKFEHFITALDVFPTLVDASGVEPPNKELDGVSLIPYLNNKKRKAPHKTHFWRYSDGAGYAVRHGDYKLVYSGYKLKHLLFDLENDPYEQSNLADKFPNKVNELVRLYEEWSIGTVKAKWYDPHAANVLKEEKKRQSFLDKASAGEKPKKI